MEIAIVGSGIAGLTVAHHLHDRHHLTVYEAAGRVGGHANTVHVDTDAGRLGVDTGFIVFNRLNYPYFSMMLDELGVATQESEMSFGVRDDRAGLEYRASNPNTVFADRRNLARPDVWRMLADILRFQRGARGFLDDPDPDLDLRSWLDERQWGSRFRESFLTPLTAAIWSADPARIEDQSAASLLGFLANHGLLRLNAIPRWRTITGGSIHYVDALSAPFRDRIRLATPVRSVRRCPDGRVELVAAGDRPRHYDRVVLACHSDQALELLADATPAEKEVLGAIAYQPNRAVLHTDASVMPRRRRAWAAWNWHRREAPSAAATVTYDSHILQRLPGATHQLVSLNQQDVIDPASVTATFDYAHPVFDVAAMRAQRRHAEIDGVGGVHYCGAWWGHGFHEDGVVSGRRVVRRIEGRAP